MSIIIRSIGDGTVCASLVCPSWGHNCAIHSVEHRNTET